MSVRRAEYRLGTGLLAADGGRLPYVGTVDHPAAPRLIEAASGSHPMRSLAAVVDDTDLEVPPFIYIEAATTCRASRSATFD